MTIGVGMTHTFWHAMHTAFVKRRQVGNTGRLALKGFLHFALRAAELKAV